MAKKHQIPHSTIVQLLKDGLKDPLSPRPNPTEAFWQLPEASISHARSAEIPAKTTYAIIGSGITGCSIAKNLLDNLPSDSSCTATVLEARALTSGATGRNGGHLLSPFPEEFLAAEKHFGRDEAVKIARFANRTLEKMYGLVDGADAELVEAAEMRKVRSVTACWSEEIFETTKASHRRYEECLPEFKGDHEVFTPEEGLQKFNLKDTCGVITNSAGAFWPYRLVTGIFSRLLKQYPGRFSIETETPVTSIRHDSTTSQEYPYILSTARGDIRASKVIHCTNGWSGHLLPRFRGKIYPLRGTMSVQEAGPSFPHEGHQQSWGVVGDQVFDGEDQTFSFILYYITQNAHTGDIFIGGEKQKLANLLSSDDTTIEGVSKSTLEGILPRIYGRGWEALQKPNVKKLWSGVMGFTPDNLPWVGRLPAGVTARKGDGEYIAAGFNGYGMPLCWGCGEAVAKMVLGRENEVKEWLPESFLLSERRLRSPASTIEAALYVLLKNSLGLWTKVYLGWRVLSRMVRRAVLG